MVVKGKGMRERENVKDYKYFQGLYLQTLREIVLFSQVIPPYPPVEFVSVSCFTFSLVKNNFFYLFISHELERKPHIMKLYFIM